MKRISHVRMGRNVKLGKSDLVKWLNQQFIGLGDVWVTLIWKSPESPIIEKEMKRRSNKGALSLSAKFPSIKYWIYNNST
jgi:hypothetical protein